MGVLSVLDSEEDVFIGKTVNASIPDVDNDAESNDADIGEAISVCSNFDEDDKEMPSDVYFKDFFSFALWGYISPSGGEDFKSSLMADVVD